MSKAARSPRPQKWSGASKFQVLLDRMGSTAPILKHAYNHKVKCLNVKMDWVQIIKKNHNPKIVVLELLTGFEPVTSSLPRMRSTY